MIRLARHLGLALLGILLNFAVAGLVEAQTMQELASLDGAMATISDSHVVEGVGRAQIFALLAINGMTVEDSIQASRAASNNKGLRLEPSILSRPIPAGREVSVLLRGQHTNAAPIQDLIAGLTQSDYVVEGTVNWIPMVGGRYVVRGELNVGGSTVWVEDVDSGRRVSEVIRGAPALNGPPPTYEVPDIHVSFACGECDVRPDAAIRIVDAYRRLAVKSGAKVLSMSSVEVVVDQYYARPDIARMFLAFTLKNDEIRARVRAPAGEFTVTDYYRTNYLGADSLAANIGELIFKGLSNR